MIVVEKNGMYTTWVSEIGAFNTKLEKEKYGMHYTDDELQVMQTSSPVAHGKTICFARLATLHAMTGSIYED